MCRSGLECFVLPYDVLVIGRPSCDLVFTGLPSWPNVGREIFAQSLTVSAGGAFNTVAALHRLGLRSGLVGIVGSDSWSERSLDAIRSEGVPTDLLLALDRPLPSVSVCLTHAGDRGFVTYEPPAEDVRDAFIEHALDVVVRQCGGYLLCWLTDQLPAFAAAARARGMRVLVDCGWNETWLASEQIRALMPLADVVLANEPEAAVITGEADPRLAVRRLGELAPFVVVKRGVAGSSAVVEGREYHAPTEPVDQRPGKHEAERRLDQQGQGFQVGSCGQYWRCQGNRTVLPRTHPWCEEAPFRDQGGELAPCSSASSRPTWKCEITWSLS